jgi:hypothetical protein
MSLQITICYHGQQISYNVTVQQEEAYLLCKSSNERTSGSEYIPDKINIRRKGKIWINDVETHSELIGLLVDEISQFNSTNNQA